MARTVKTYMLDNGKDRIHKQDVHKIAGASRDQETLLGYVVAAGLFVSHEKPLKTLATTTRRKDANDQQTQTKSVHCHAVANADPMFYIAKIETEEGLGRLFPTEARDLPATFPERYSQTSVKKLLGNIAVVREITRVLRSHTALLVQKHDEGQPTSAPHHSSEAP